MIKISVISRWTLFSIVTLLGITACSTMPGQSKPVTTVTLKDGAPPFPVDVSQLKNAVPKYEPKSHYGNPPVYTIQGKQYYVMDSAKGYNKTGIASWYGTKFHGRPTSSREPYDMLAMTAASPTLPIPSYARVTNLENGQQIIVRVNDRGPFANDRIMDLSYAAAKKLGYVNKGTARVKVEAIIVSPPPTALPILAAKKQLYVQVGSFQKMSKAEQEKTKVAQLTHQPARIETINLNDKTLYRVQIGPLMDLQKSNIVNQLLQQGYSKPMLVFS